MTDYRLAASAEMLFLELPFVERVKHIHERGFEVEIWNWTKQDLNVLASTGATFSNMTGYIEGDLLEEDGIERLLSTAKLALEASKIVDVPRLNMHGTGLDANGQSIRKRQVVTGAEWLTARDTLAKLAELGELYGKEFTLENLNLRVDHPGTPFARSEDVITLIESVNSPGLTLNLDLYHAQVDEGNLGERRAHHRHALRLDVDDALRHPPTRAVVDAPPVSFREAKARTKLPGLVHDAFAAFVVNLPRLGQLQRLACVQDNGGFGVQDDFHCFSLQATVPSASGTVVG